jgi:hypothetical protein
VSVHGVKDVGMIEDTIEEMDMETVTDVVTVMVEGTEIN